MSTDANKAIILVHVCGYEDGEVRMLSTHSTLRKAIERMAVLVREDIARGGAWSQDDCWDRSNEPLPSILANPNRHIELLDVYPSSNWFAIEVHTADMPLETYHLITAEDVRNYVERTT